MGRPPGARLGRGQKHWSAQSWPEYDDRFEELETDDDAMHGVGLDQGYRPKRFVSDELRFTGIDLGGGGAARRRRSYEDYSNSDDEEYDGSTGLVRRGEHQVMLREKEDVLVERALERIRRARALGKTDVKLEPLELEALQRAGVIPRPPSNPAPVPKAAPKGKKAAHPKPKAIESRKNSKDSKSASSSPKVKAIEGRARGRSSASSRSKSDSKDSKAEAEAMVPYPILPDDRYGYMYPPAYYARGSAPTSRQQSQARTNPSQSLRKHPQPMPPYQHPYYQSRYYSNPDMYGPRPSSNSSRVSRSDPADPDWEPRARSSSSLVPYPLDQLPQAGSGKAPRFNPEDPRYASPPTRRIVSGPPAAQHRRPQDEIFMPHEEPEVMQYLTNSSHEEDDDEQDAETGDSDESGQGVQVDVEERGGGGYAIQTRAAAAKGNGKGAAAKRRR